ncbi:MAG: hypothetical protein EBX41_08460 [Chitinophagia bacterium]|nr:hypothetical protein [Chitinophagia bacterium]
MKVHGIQAVDVDIDESVFNIKLNDTATLSPDAVKKAVTDAGFSVSSFTMTVDLPATTIENDAHIVIGNATYHFLNVPKQNIAGKVALRLLDKQFTTAAEHKKYKKYTTMACYETGVTGKCCPNSSSSASRVYHVTL